MTTEIFYSDNLLEGNSAADFTIRSGVEKSFLIPIAEAGFIDASIGIWHDLAVDCEVNITIALPVINGGSFTHKYGQELLNIPAVGSDHRVLIMAERGTSNVSASTKEVYAIPELRAGVPAIYVFVDADSAPTEGELNLIVTRRR